MAFLLLLCISTSLFGNDIIYADNLNMNFPSTKDYDVHNLIDRVALYQRMSKDFPAEYDELIKSGANDDKILATYAILTAQRVFDKIKKEEQDKIMAKSVKTGRKLIQHGFVQHLDRGEYLESDKCNQNNCSGKHDFDFHKCFADYTCEYPDGFENYMIQIKDKGEFNEFKKISVDEDDKSQNIRRRLIVNLKTKLNASDISQFSKIYFDYKEILCPYDAYAQRRKIEKINEKNGYWIARTTECEKKPNSSKCKEYMHKNYMPIPDVECEFIDWGHRDVSKVKKFLTREDDMEFMD